MESYSVTLLRKDMVATDTMAFYLKKPTGFQYHAGQYVEIALDHMKEMDKKGNSRNFSLASAPFEDELMVVTRLRDTAFKHTLRTLSKGDEVRLRGPYGSFTLPKDPLTPAVFISGGIGATFTRSVLIQAEYDHSDHLLWAFCSAPSPEDAIFIDELTMLSSKNKNSTFVPVFTKTQSDAQPGEQGRISLAMLRKYIGNMQAPIYYLSGSAAMVVAVRKMLIDAGVNKFNIRFDQFIGY